MHWAVCAAVIEDGDAVTVIPVTEEPEPATEIDTVAKPDLLGSCVDVAVMVAAPDPGVVEGAVYKPLLVTVPAEADHVTAEL